MMQDRAPLCLSGVAQAVVGIAAEYPEAPEIVLVGYWYWNTSHQEKLGDFGCRCPGTDAAFGLIVEQVLATKSRKAILLERGGELALAGIPELVSTRSTRYTPPSSWFRRIGAGSAPAGLQFVQ
jgi:hypothetical protein